MKCCYGDMLWTFFCGFWCQAKALGIWNGTELNHNYFYLQYIVCAGRTTAMTALCFLAKPLLWCCLLTASNRLLFKCPISFLCITFNVFYYVFFTMKIQVLLVPFYCWWCVDFANFCLFTENRLAANSSILFSSFLVSRCDQNHVKTSYPR